MVLNINLMIERFLKFVEMRWDQIICIRNAADMQVMLSKSFFRKRNKAKRINWHQFASEMSVNDVENQEK